MNNPAPQGFSKRVEKFVKEKDEANNRNENKTLKENNKRNNNKRRGNIPKPFFVTPVHNHLRIIAEDFTRMIMVEVNGVQRNCKKKNRCKKKVGFHNPSIPRITK